MNIVLTLNKIEDKIHNIFLENRTTPGVIIINHRTWNEIVYYLTRGLSNPDMWSELKYKNLQVYRSEDIKDGEVEVY